MTDPKANPNPPAAADSPASPARLGAIDQWMAAHPWHPRITPYVIYVLLLAVIQFLPAGRPATYLRPIVYALQCAVVLWLLWRYRRLLPELNGRFHWLAVPVGVGVFVAWVLLGWAMAGELHPRLDALLDGQPIGMIDYGPDGDKPHFATTAAGPFDPRHPDRMGPTVGWISLLLRLLGMSIVVPLFEELFVRSLLLRSLHHFRTTAIGLIHFFQDLPVFGDWLMHTRLAQRANRHEPVFGRVFTETPLGQLSVFGVFASTVVFSSYHAMRDWPAAVVCGVAYCLLLYATRRRGLGPVVWAHGITNALLWIYTLTTADWQFL